MPQLFLLHYITQCHFHFSGSKKARHMYVTNHVQITSLLTYKIIMPDQGRRDQGDGWGRLPPPQDFARYVSPIPIRGRGQIQSLPFYY